MLADLPDGVVVYDVEKASRNGIIYPSLDPSIFEVKYPNQDILGKVVGDI